MDTENKIPENAQAEQAVLGCIVIDGELISKIRQIIRPEDFYYKENSLIFTAMLELADEHQEIDIITLSDRLRNGMVLDLVGGSARLAELTNDVVTTFHWKEYCKIVADAALKRRVLATGSALIKTAQNGATGEETLKKVEESLEAVVQHRTDVDQKYQVASMLDYVDGAKERFKNWGKVVGLSSGFNSLDNLTKGFVGGEMIIIAGKTSYGKTTLAMNIANRVALQGYRVLFVTLEMTHEELTSRFMFINGGDNDNFYKVAANVLYQKNDQLGWEDIDGVVEKARKELEVDLVIIDHLHYFTRELNNVAEDLGRITKEVKKNAIRHNIPIILISHVRKGMHGVDVNIDDLRGSSYIAQDADIVLMVGRHPESGDMMVRIEKNRNRGFDARNDADVINLFFDQTRLIEEKDAWWKNIDDSHIPTAKIPGVDY